MDERLYTYDYRRPRWNNPTYLSGGVSTSLALFMEPVHAQINPYVNNGNPVHQTKHEQMNNSSVHIEQNKSTVREEQIRNSSQPKIQDKEKNSPSRLSNIGSSTLNEKNTQYNIFGDKEVYNKQDKRFNIITNRPKQYQQTIKQYPKLHLEDKDAYYYQRLQQMHNYDQFNSNDNYSKPTAYHMQQKQDEIRGVNLKPLNNVEYTTHNIL